MSARRRVGILLLAAGVLAVGWWLRATPRGWEGAADHVREAPLEDPALADAEVAAAAVARVRAAWTAVPPPADTLGSLPGRPVWACAHAPRIAPVCGAGRGETLAAALDDAGRGLAAAAEGVEPGGRRLSLDLWLAETPSQWPGDPRPHDAGVLGMRVGDTVILPWEVLARGLFRSPAEEEPPAWDEDALRVMLGFRGARVGERFAFSWLRTVTWAEPEPGAPPLRTYRLHAWEQPEPSDPEVLESAAVGAAEHLAGLVGDDGRIRYRYDPTTGRTLPGQNLLRHAGSVYSLIQAWDRFRYPSWRDAAERALEYLLRQSRSDVREGPYGGGRGRWIAEGSHVKLGGAGLALVALATYEQTTGDERWRETAREFGRFLVSQQREDGEFVCFPSLRPGGEPRDQTSAYYPGEAILGLALLYDLDPDPLWLETAKRGADWLIDVRDAGKGRNALENDHWLMIALSHLYGETRDPRYLDHALRLADAVAAQAERQQGHDAWHRDYRGGFYEPPRATPAATRAEGLVAVLDTCAEAGRDCASIAALLDRTVAHLLQSRVAPETAFWMPDPGGGVGGFLGGVTAAEMRNDFTQHALSALLGAERLRAAADGRRLPRGPGDGAADFADWPGEDPERLERWRSPITRAGGGAGARPPDPAESPPLRVDPRGGSSPESP